MRYDAAVGLAVELLVLGGRRVVDSDVAPYVANEADQFLGRWRAADRVDLTGDESDEVRSEVMEVLHWFKPCSPFRALP